MRKKSWEQGRKRVLYPLGGIVFLFILFSIYFFFSSDAHSYQHLIEKMRKEEKSASLSYHSQQIRQKVDKSILFSQGGERRQARLISDQSEIELIRDVKETAVLEHLHHFICWIEEKSDIVLDKEGREQSMQTLHRFEAKEGTYDYRTGKLIAEEATIKQFHLPKGVSLDQIDDKGYEPIVSGKAHSVTFSLKGKEVAFQASQLAIEDRRKKEIHIKAAKGSYANEQMILEGDLVFTCDLGKITADVMTFDCQTMKGTFSSYTNASVVFQMTEWEKKETPLLHIRSDRMSFQVSGNLKSKEKKHFTSIVAEGRTELIHSDEEKGTSYTLLSQGKVEMDHEKQKIFLSSPKDEQEKVIKNKQISFKNYLGEIQTDHVEMDYVIAEKRIAVSKVILTGNVRLRNQFSTSFDQTHPFDQYALADQVVYFPESREMTLSAFSHRRVLFFDRLNNIQVSAPALEVVRDPITKKESFHGKGDVRFKFIEQEMLRFQQQFNMP